MYIPVILAAIEQTVSVAVLVLSAWLWLLRLQVCIFGDTSEGMVVGYKPTFSSEDSPYPIVCFTDGAGVAHEFETGWTFNNLKRGSRVMVRYLPSNPKQAYVNGFSRMWLVPLGLTALGLAGIL